MNEASPRPTPAEMEILQVLWDLGPSTVREVYRELSRQKDVGYTSVLKFLQIMHVKGLVSRTEEGRAHRYCAAAKPEHTERGVVKDLLDRVFSGSASRLVLRALEAKPLPPDERERIRAILDEFDREGER